jgi:hypothetical protein
MVYDFEHSKCKVCGKPPTNVIKYIYNLEEYFIPTCGDDCSRRSMMTLPLDLICIACSKHFTIVNAQISMISHSEKTFMEIVCSPQCVHARNTRLNEKVPSDVKIKLSYKCKVCQKECNKKCSRCGLDYYCSPKCQKADWHNHKSICTAKK